MFLSEFIYKAVDITIEQADNGLYYLNPLWRFILEDNQLYLSDVSDGETDINGIEDVLKLEVEKRNTINSLKPYVTEWIYNLITASIEPAVLQEETDYIKNLAKYLKENKEAQDLKEE